MNKQSLTQLALSGILAGGMLLTACEKSATAPADNTSGGIKAAKTLAAFQTECSKIAGASFTAAVSGESHSCAGYSFLTKDNSVVQHTCQGISACNGGSCKEG